jgi:MerR family transcriptional regulator, light-induced transcriptional regulator
MGPGSRIGATRLPAPAGGNPDSRRRRIPSVVKKLAIKDLAEETGLAAGTIRMWEQRYGFPEPERTPAGYRIYTSDDVVMLRRVLAFRARGLSVPAALERARSLQTVTDRPSIFGALASGDAPVRPQRLHKPTLVAISRAIEEEALARAAGPVIIGAFQAERNYRAVEHRYRRMARLADVTAVFADFARLRAESDDEPAEIPIERADALGHEWAVVVDAPGYAACLVGWETPESSGDPRRRARDRVFETVWTMDPRVVREAAHVGAGLVARAAPELGARMLALLADRPLAVDGPAPALTALTNRMLGYLDAATG